jgi:hypothetical protein
MSCDEQYIVAPDAHDCGHDAPGHTTVEQGVLQAWDWMSLIDCWTSEFVVPVTAELREMIELLMLASIVAARSRFWPMTGQGH